MTCKTFLDFLPINFRHEKDFLIQNNLLDLEILSTLTDIEISNIQRNAPLCTLNNLKKIRAIAIFKKQIAISPPEAYLLLHCGVGSIRVLSQLNPNELSKKIGRLERNLRSKTGTKITSRILKDWIERAKQINTSN
mgnify:CR=1 FL=1